MEKAYAVQLFSAFDGRVVGPPQIVAMGSDALAEYLAVCLESGYEAAVDCPMGCGAAGAVDFLAYTHEERLRSLGHDGYVAELAQELAEH